MPMLVVVLLIMSHRSQGGNNAPPSSSLIPLFNEHLSPSLRIGVVTYNLGASLLPPHGSLPFLLPLSHRCDVLSINTQETEPVKPRRAEGSRSVRLRRLVIKALMGGNGNGSGNGRGKGGGGEGWIPLAIHSMGGMQSMLFVREGIRDRVRNVVVEDVSTGIGNVVVNKGGIGVFVTLKKSSVCDEDYGEDDAGTDTECMVFINSHLAAHEGKWSERDKDFHRISEVLRRGYEERTDRWSRGYVRDGGEGRRRMRRRRKMKKKGERGGNENENENENEGRPERRRQDSDDFDVVPLISKIPHVFWAGDLNYRLSLPRAAVEGILLEGGRFGRGKKEASYDDDDDDGGGDETMSDSFSSCYSRLLSHDQLTMSMVSSRAFGGLAEGRITFPPTYKYDPGTGVYDTSRKERVPSYTDRILWKPGKGVKCKRYYVGEEGEGRSDHRPVLAEFEVEI